MVGKEKINDEVQEHKHLQNILFSGRGGGGGGGCGGRLGFLQNKKNYQVLKMTCPV